jgi:hypothetical protein
MPWRACRVMDERLRFVARLLEGEKMAPLCAECGISRKTGCKLYERNKDCGLGAFSDRSRRPHRQANRPPPPIEATIVRLKREDAVIRAVTADPESLLRIPRWFTQGPSTRRRPIGRHTLQSSELSGSRGAHTSHAALVLCLRNSYTYSVSMRPPPGVTTDARAFRAVRRGRAA